MNVDFGSSWKCFGLVCLFVNIEYNGNYILKIWLEVMVFYVFVVWY